MRHHGHSVHRPHHIHVGHGTTVNINQTGSSVTQKLGHGQTLTTGTSGTTYTTTTSTGFGLSVTTQTRNGHTHTHVNHRRNGFPGWF
jgi:hypothetical protein